MLTATTPSIILSNNQPWILRFAKNKPNSINWGKGNDDDWALVAFENFWISKKMPVIVIIAFVCRTHTKCYIFDAKMQMRVYDVNARIAQQKNELECGSLHSFRLRNSKQCWKWQKAVLRVAKAREKRRQNQVIRRSNWRRSWRMNCRRRNDENGFSVLKFHLRRKKERQRSIERPKPKTFTRRAFKWNRLLFFIFSFFFSPLVSCIRKTVTHFHRKDLREYERRFFFFVRSDKKHEAKKLKRTQKKLTYNNLKFIYKRAVILIIIIQSTIQDCLSLTCAQSKTMEKVRFSFFVTLQWPTTTPTSAFVFRVCFSCLLCLCFLSVIVWPQANYRTVETILFNCIFRSFLHSNRSIGVQSIDSTISPAQRWPKFIVVDLINSSNANDHCIDVNVRNKNKLRKQDRKRFLRHFLLLDFCGLEILRNRSFLMRNQWTRISEKKS